MYSEQERFVVADLSALRIFNEPVHSESDNRVWAGSLIFSRELEGTGSQLIKSLRLLDFQLEDLVEKVGCSSDEQLSRILNPIIFDNSAVNVIVHKRIVGNTYINPKTKKEFVVNPSDNYSIGDIVYSVELDTNEPVILSDEAKSYLREIGIAADNAVQQNRITSRASSFEERKAARLAAVSKRLKTHVKDEPKGLSPELQEELDTLLQVSKPTGKQKERIAELQS